MMNNALYDFVKQRLLSNFRFTSKLARNKGGEILHFTEEIFNGKNILTFTQQAGISRLVITAEKINESVIFSLTVEVQAERGVQSKVASESALSLQLGNIFPDALLGSFLEKALWHYPVFANKFCELPDDTQSVLVKY